MFSRPKILFLVSLLFVALFNPKFNPYLPFKFLIFIILVCLLFIHAKHSIIFSRRTKCYKRLRNNYACLQVLVNNMLTWQSSCVIANNAQKTQKLFVQGYN